MNQDEAGTKKMGSEEERELVRRLKLVEALHAGGATEGEKQAAAEAAKRIRERLQSYANLKTAEFTFKMDNMWERKLFVALLRRYGIKPYRYPKQRYTTVMTKVPERFVAETLWPAYLEMSSALQKYMNTITDRIIGEAIHQDSSDAAVVAESVSLLLRLELDKYHRQNIC